jgi:hypothetical protein
VLLLILTPAYKCFPKFREKAQEKLRQKKKDLFYNGIIIMISVEFMKANDLLCSTITGDLGTFESWGTIIIVGFCILAYLVGCTYILIKNTPDLLLREDNIAKFGNLYLGVKVN